MPTMFLHLENILYKAFRGKTQFNKYFHFLKCVCEKNLYTRLFMWIVKREKDEVQLIFFIFFIFQFIISKVWSKLFSSLKLCTKKGMNKVFGDRNVQVFHWLFIQHLLSPRDGANLLCLFCYWANVIKVRYQGIKTL